MGSVFERLDLRYGAGTRKWLVPSLAATGWLMLGACGETAPSPEREPPVETAPVPSAEATSEPTPEATPAAADPPAAALTAEPPLPPEPTAPIACAALGASITVYEGTLRDGTLRLTALVSGSAEHFARPPLALAGEAVDLDGDGTDDFVGRYVYETGDPECGNWGECIMGAAVRCDGGWALVSPIDYRLGVRAGTTRTEHAGRRFRVLLEAARSGDMDEEGGERFWTTVLAMGEGGYGGSIREPWFESEQCVALFAEGRLMHARDMCEQGLTAHPRGRVRGALYFDLGRIAEAEGRVEDARAAYRASLEARPGNAIVDAALTALAPPSETPSPR